MDVLQGELSRLQGRHVRELTLAMMNGAKSATEVQAVRSRGQEKVQMEEEMSVTKAHEGTMDGQAK